MFCKTSPQKLFLPGLSGIMEWGDSIHDLVYGHNGSIMAKIIFLCFCVNFYSKSFCNVMLWPGFCRIYYVYEVTFMFKCNYI